MADTKETPGWTWRSRPTVFHDWVYWTCVERPPFAPGCIVEQAR